MSNVPDVNRPIAPDPYSLLPHVPTFVLTSDDITDGKPMGVKQSAGGGSVSPQLSWSGFPAGTRSFLLTCFDPDAPLPGGYWHWLVSDIPVSVTSIPSGKARSMLGLAAHAVVRRDNSTGIDDAIDLPNSARIIGFTGALPPRGDRAHRYFFAVHALNVDHLDLPHGKKTEPHDVAAAALPYTIARAVLVGTYQRP